MDKILKKVRPGDMVCCGERELKDFYPAFMVQTVNTEIIAAYKRKYNLLRVSGIGKLIRTYDSDQSALI